MVTVKELTIAPVKSTALLRPLVVHVTGMGIIEDRRFYVVDAEGKLVTQRQVGALALVRADYQPQPERLTLYLPDGREAGGAVETGEAVETNMFSRPVQGHVLRSEWNTLLSNFCGQPLRVVRSELPGQCQDIYPLSLLSEASVGELNRRAGSFGTFEESRFRPNLLLAGCAPHEEDEWVDRCLRVGDELLVRIVERDPRCSLATINPRTGERDADTLRAIASYRRAKGAAYFGVYATVQVPGSVRIGDVVEIE